MIGLSCICFFTFFVEVFQFPKGQQTFCGYESCPKTDPAALNVHLVAHSHDDVGWVKTVDKYYYEDVELIISSVVSALKKNPERRFIQVETAFLKKWWKEQTEQKRQEFRQLVDEGRLEIVNGAWSMNDEADVNYQSTVDQFTLGLRFLEDNIGPCARPKIGWQIDPFGHSREHASLLTQFGFDGLFFARLDYRDKDEREANKSMELLWRTSQFSNNSYLFTSVLDNHYSAPDGFCFDITCKERIIDDEDSPEYNYVDKVEKFAEFCSKLSEKYITNNVLITMGDDFKYKAALINFLNMDKLIKGFKLFPQFHRERRINVMYSTPSCYVKAVNQYIREHNIKLPEKSDDFFPYADTPHRYWTGYYTSRPISKRYERQGNNLLQVTKHLSTIKISKNEDEKVKSLKEAMGTMQHHDAITGTEQEHVLESYHESLLKSMEKATEASSSFIAKLLDASPSNSDRPFNLNSCSISSVNTCEGRNKDSFDVILYNPLNQNVTHYVQIFVEHSQYSVHDAEGREILIQISNETRKNAEVHSKKLWFGAILPPMTLKIYQIQRIKDRGLNERADDLVPSTSAENSWIGYKTTGIKLNRQSGLLEYIKMNNITLKVTQQFMYYESGHDVNGTSGAYLFRPNGTAKNFMNGKVNYSIEKGPLFIEVKQEFNDCVSQVIRIYREEPEYIEFDWIVGPINISESYGREIISRYTVSGLRTHGKFYTDSNGREMLERRRDFRLDYEYTGEENITANYYPVTSRIVLRDAYDGTEFAVLTDRPQGGTSLQDGQVELMVHRRCRFDDEKGVDEPLNELDAHGHGIKVQGRHFITLGKSTEMIQKRISLRLLLSPWAFVTDKSIISQIRKKQVSLLKKKLPDNVHVLTLEPFEAVNGIPNKILIRLENLLENQNGTTKVDLSDLFTHFSIDKLTEMVLSANFKRKDKTRLNWTKNDNKIMESKVTGTLVTLEPMEIRTFIADVTNRGDVDDIKSHEKA